MKKISKKAMKGIRNSLVGTKNIVLRATSVPIKPKWLWIEVTDKCNSRCKFCNIWQKKPTKNILTVSEIKKALSDNLFKGLKSVVLSGGEPTTRNDLKELILSIHNTLPKAEILLGTNGLLPKKLITIVKEIIGKHDIKLAIGVSLDGTWKNHDFVRGVKDSFKKIDYLLKELIILKKSYKEKLGIATGFVLSDLTLPHLKETEAYCKKMHLDLNVQWYAESAYYNNVGKNLLTLKNQFLIDAVKSLPTTYLNERKIKLLNQRSIKFSCFALNSFCLIKCNGDVVPCFNFWNTKVGNIRKQSPTKIWHDQKAKMARKKIKKCQGCLNDCAILWSFYSSYYPILFFYLKNPRALIKKFKK